jgi:O-Antigen ligase
MSSPKQVSEDKLLGAFDYFKQSLKMAPMPVIALMIYMSLRSTAFWVDESLPPGELWHQAYLGWYDFLLLLSILGSIINRSTKMDGKDLLIFLLLLIMILLSFCSGRRIDIKYVIDCGIFLLRVFLSFSFAKGLVLRRGIQVVESILMILFIILSMSALFVFQLQFGENNRIFAAAMTSPSFGQVAVIVFLIAIVRKYNKIAILSLIFLFLTFSRTSILLLVILLAIYSRSLPFKTTLKYFTVLLGTITIGFFIITNFTGDAFNYVISERTDMEGIATLNSRDAIWESAVNIMNNGDIPAFGIGLNATPSLLQNLNSLDIITDEGKIKSVPHFHSILIEYYFGLGFSSLLLCFYFIRRIFQTFYRQCYPSFFIFAFFLVCQSLDFTFYNPKELIIWSLMLGIAEGQWISENGTGSSQIK